METRTETNKLINFYETGQPIEETTPKTPNIKNI